MHDRIHAVVGMLAVAVAGVTAPSADAAEKKVVACTLSTLASMAREIGGDRVEVFSLAKGDQDPHFVAPTPALMNRVRGADALLEIGMQLELWADEVANGSGNPRIFKGAPGRFQISTNIPKLEVPTLLSRSQGDIHPEGNPHLWTDPVRAKMMAENIAAALSQVSPENASYFAGRAKEFGGRVDKATFGDELLSLVGSRKLSRLALDGKLWEFLEANQYQGKKLSERVGGWLKRAAPLRLQKTIEFHKVWTYFATTFGFQIIGTVEEKPGIAPGPRHIADIVETVKREHVRLILVDNFYDPALPNRIAQETGARVVLLPDQVGGEKGTDDYFSLMDHVVNETLSALQKQEAEHP